MVKPLRVAFAALAPAGMGPGMLGCPHRKTVKELGDEIDDPTDEG